MPLIFPSNTLSGGYTVDNSCRFNDGDSAQMQKDTTSSDGIVDATISMWVKRATLGTAQVLLAGNYKSNNNYYCSLSFTSGDALSFKNYDNATNCELITNRLFRDPSAWYFICVECDLSDAEADRVKIYINGTTRETSFSTTTNMTGDQFLLGKSGYQVGVGALQDASYFDGYMAEVCYVDGNAAGSPLTPTSFGEFDSDSPTIWKPKDVSGLSFGANGFYLDFEDSSNLGNDANGGTDLTESNLAAVDQASDSPTNNFATLNSVYSSDSQPTLSEGNLGQAPSTTTYQNAFSTIGAASGKWYVEMKVNGTANSANYFGVAAETECDYLQDNANVIGKSTKGFSISMASGDKRTDETNSSYGSVIADGDIFMIALDIDNAKVWFGSNGTWFDSGDPAGGSNEAFSSINTDYPYFFGGTVYTGGYTSVEWNFGNPSFTISSGNADADGYGNFEYAVPSGFYALCTKNLAEYG